MKINVSINKTLKDSISDKRTSLYIWKGLAHLKDFYADVVDGETINKIADEIQNGKRLINNQKYIKREGLGEALNESCLCNLIEMQLLNNQDVLDKFLEKPVVFK